VLPGPFRNLLDGQGLIRPFASDDEPPGVWRPRFDVRNGEEYQNRLMWLHLREK
jgi:hypothetical protein